MKKNRGGVIIPVKTKYNSLLFDLDDTLLDYSTAEVACALKVLENHEMPCGSDVAEFFLSINEWHSFELGQEITAYHVITNRFGYFLKVLEVKDEELIRTMREEYFALMQANHKLKKGALKTVRYLKEQGYRLYITTNGYPEFQRKRIKSSRIRKYFDGIFISEEIGSQKPSAAFFNYVVNHISENRREKLLIIGDAPTSDIMGGINSKIDTCFLSNNGRACKFKYTYKIKKLEDLLNLL